MVVSAGPKSLGIFSSLFSTLCFSVYGGQFHFAKDDCDEFVQIITVRAENISELIPAARKIEFESCK